MQQSLFKKHGLAVLRLIGLICYVFAGRTIAAELSPQYVWPIKDAYSIMDTISTLQFYGGRPGFHHGLDIKAAAGTAVYAPVGGSVAIGYYYPRAKTPYTYAVFIDADDGNRWEFHHIDQQTIPDQIRSLADQRGRIEAGTPIAKIYDAPRFDPTIPPHVHIDVIDQVGIHQNPLRFFPPLADKTPPEFRGVYFADSDNHVVAQWHNAAKNVSVKAGVYDMVVDLLDVIDGEPAGDSIARLSVTCNDQTITDYDFRNSLPSKDFLEGVSAVYKVEPIVLPDGTQLTNQIDPSKPRVFLYRVRFDTNRLHPDKQASVTLYISAEDFAGNRAQAEFRLNLKPF
ncbi:M23 family metallopeptidase [Methylomonas sp. MgM2]